MVKHHKLMLLRPQFKQFNLKKLNINSKSVKQNTMQN